MVEATWVPHLRDGDTSYTWTWGDYELRPTTQERASEYFVFYRGVPIDDKPRCLRRSRRAAQRHEGPEGDQ